VRRRRSIVTVNLVAAAAALGGAQLHPNSDWQFAAAFFLGGTTFPLYSLNLSHVNDVLEARQTVAASSLFVFLTGAGSVLGPIGASVLMARTHPDALFWMIGGVHLTVAAYVVYRIIVHEGVPVANQRRFLSIPARASALIGVLVRSRRNHG
jgi:MFS family permease